MNFRRLTGLPSCRESGRAEAITFGVAPVVHHSKIGRQVQRWVISGTSEESRRERNVRFGSESGGRPKKSNLVVTAEARTAVTMPAIARSHAKLAPLTTRRGRRNAAGLEPCSNGPQRLTWLRRFAGHDGSFRYGPRLARLTRAPRHASGNH